MTPTSSTTISHEALSLLTKIRSLEKAVGDILPEETTGIAFLHQDTEFRITHPNFRAIHRTYTENIALFLDHPDAAAIAKHVLELIQAFEFEAGLTVHSAFVCQADDDSSITFGIRNTAFLIPQSAYLIPKH